MQRALMQSRWTPVERNAWSLRAYGRKVMHESNGGSLIAHLSDVNRSNQIYIQAEVVGRMLVEAYCNGVQILDVIVANEELDCFIDLSPARPTGRAEVELVFIPATLGEVKIARELKLVDTNEALSAVEAIGAS